MLAASDQGCGVDSETSIMEYLDFDRLIPHPAATGWLHVIPATLSQRHSFVRKALSFLFYPFTGLFKKSVSFIQPLLGLFFRISLPKFG